MTRTTIAILAATAILVLFMSLQREHSQKAAEPKPVPVSMANPVPTTPAQDGTINHYHPAPVSLDVRRKVDNFIKRHDGEREKDLLNNPDVVEALSKFAEVINSPAIQQKMDSRLEGINAVKDLGSGSLTFGLDTDESFGSPKNRAFLEAAISGDPNLIEAWVTNTLDGAIFELAFDPTLDQTSSGVKLHPSLSSCLKKNHTGGA